VPNKAANNRQTIGTAMGLMISLKAADIVDPGCRVRHVWRLPERFFHFVIAGQKVRSAVLA
jgi:hypothetical protein